MMARSAVSRIQSPDTLITPLNDSFLDFDVLGAVDPEPSRFRTPAITPKWFRRCAGSEPLRVDRSIGVVMRNRLSMVGTRNKRLVGAALQELSQKLEFRTVEGFAERMIFREFYPRGLTALDDFDGVTLGTRPTMSHATARQEVASLLNRPEFWNVGDPRRRCRRTETSRSATGTPLESAASGRSRSPSARRRAST